MADLAAVQLKNGRNPFRTEECPVVVDTMIVVFVTGGENAQ